MTLSAIESVDFRNLNNREEQAELTDCVCEALIIDRLGHIDVGSEVVATLDLAAVVGSGEHDHRRALEVNVALDLSKDVGTRHVRQVEVEEDHEVLPRIGLSPAIRTEQIGKRARSIDKGQDLIIDAGGQGLGSALRDEIAPLHLHIDATINLGIVVTEWVTNAFKYAYPDRSGEIRVFLRQLANDEIELAVEDDGAGRDDGPAKGTGLGTRIVKAVAASMGAEIEYKQRHPGTLARLILTVRSND